MAEVDLDPSPLPLVRDVEVGATGVGDTLPVGEIEEVKVGRNREGEEEEEGVKEGVREEQPLTLPHAVGDREGVGVMVPLMLPPSPAPSHHPLPLLPPLTAQGV